MDFTAKQVGRIIEVLQDSVVTDTQPLEGFTYIACGYTADNRPPSPDAGWMDFPPDGRVGGRDAHYWFRRQFRTPAAQEGRTVYFHLDTSAPGDGDGVNPQTLVFLNGEITQGMDINHRDVPLLPDTDYDMYLYFYVGMIDGQVAVRPSLRWVDTRIEKLYYDLSVPFDVCRLYGENDGDYVAIMGCLHRAVQLLDLRQLYSAAFYQSIADADACLETHLYGQLCRQSGPAVWCIGHTHIDVAWMWTLAQTREKAQRSFATVLSLMRQYPEYKFMASQPQLYQYVKEAAPALYQKIKQAAAQGRWEVEGAMWLEADCNLVSGESLVRQIMHGKQFMKEEFGVDSHILWLPDVFGYSAALPQILKKCGVDKFVTSKISWNESNRMPYDTFYWEGIDGTEIFTYFITAQDSPKKGSTPETFTTYVGYIRPSQVLGTWERYQPKQYNHETLLAFGFGDGGGGPTSDMLEQQRRLSRGLPGMPYTKMGTVAEFLDRAQQNFSAACRAHGETPRWVGELYLELHRGTYTTMAHNKRCNRKSEQLYQMAEAASAAANVLLGRPYPAAQLHNGWETILLNQFHDIIPGSSIREVYEDSARQYQDVLAQGEAVFSGALDALAGQVATGGGLLVYNPLPMPFRGAVPVDGRYVEVADIPAHGWKVVQPVPAAGTVTVSAQRMENRYFAIAFDAHGEIVSLYDKEAGRELARSGETLNQLRVYEDYPYMCDAWELSPYYREKMWKADSLDGIRVLHEDARAGLEITRTYQRSAIVQRIYLYENSRRIDFETEVDWAEDHVVLKAAFPLDIHASEATYEIQFGSVKRPLHRNTSWDAAKFEVCAQKWADVSEETYGVSLLNDCKYGHSSDGGTLMLTLLRAPTYPNPDADRGRHTFTYALYPHTGGLTAETVHEAYRLNRPPVVRPLPRQGGCLPAQWSLVQISCPYVVVDTIKQAEDGDGIIVRLYGCGNRREKAALSFGFDLTDVQLCDIMENTISSIETAGNCVHIDCRPFEILTLRVRPAAGI